MRLLHTSDWHLGQHFLGRTRQAEHHAFLQWLLGQVREQAVDAVIVAGDVFDTGAPPSYARELYNTFCAGLHDTGAALVVLGGNHDSPATLAEGRALLACLGTQVIPAVAPTPAGQVLLLPQRDGAPGALLCAVPFIRPRDVMESQAGQEARDKQEALHAGIAAHYAALYAEALRVREHLGQTLPIVATGHLTTVGASTSDSVREIYVGTLAAFPAVDFPPADYIALGHIHRPQKVAGSEHIRYCGAPLPLGFDEAGSTREILLVDLDAGGLRAVTPCSVPCFQPLAAVRGTLAELPRLLADAARDGLPEQPVWLEVTVCGDDYLNDLQIRVAELVAPLPVEVLALRRARPGSASAMAVEEAHETLTELGPAEVFERRLALEEMDEGLRDKLRTRFSEVLSSVQGEIA